MNTVNNKRRRASQNKIEKVFVELIQEKEVHEITVTDICNLARINRSTFYGNYVDIYDLVDKMRDKMLQDFSELYADEREQKYNSNDFLKLFYHIKENQLFYKTYFKLNFDLNLKIIQYDEKLAQQRYQNQNIEYHMQFFRGGITYMIKLWLYHGCDISPEELFEVIKQEYTKS